MVIDLCPKCRNPLVSEVICTIPPIPVKRCYVCGWSWEGTNENLEFRVWEEKNEKSDNME